MAKRVILLLIFIFCWLIASYAEKPSAEENIIGSTFKTLAKAFVGMVDLDRLKLNNIVKVKKMDVEKFRRRYAEVYPVLKELPEGIRVKYKIEKDMSQEQAVRNIAVLDSKKIEAIIDAIPDKVIAGQFNLYLNKKKQELRNPNLPLQINKLWSAIVEKAFNK